MKKYVRKIQEKLENTLKDFLAVIGLSLDLVQKRSGTDTYSGRSNGSWDRTAEKMLENFQRTGDSNHSMYQRL